MGARSSSAPRTFVIGDVHGCLDELRALVAAARRHRRRRRGVRRRPGGEGPGFGGRRRVGARAWRRRRSRQPRRSRVGRPSRGSRCEGASPEGRCVAEQGRRQVAGRAPAVGAACTWGQAARRRARRHGSGRTGREAGAREPAAHAQHHRRRPALEAHRGCSVGFAVDRARARRVRPRRDPRPADACARDRPRHRLRLRSRADRPPLARAQAGFACRRAAPTRR